MKPIGERADRKITSPGIAASPSTQVSPPNSSKPKPPDPQLHNSDKLNSTYITSKDGHPFEAFYDPQLFKAFSTASEKEAIGIKNRMTLDINDIGKAGFDKKLAETFRRYGFVILKNHPLSKSKIEAVYKHARDFFDQDQETKNTFARPDLHGQRGYKASIENDQSGKPERAESAQFDDPKEFLHFGTDNNTVDGKDYSEQFNDLAVEASGLYQDFNFLNTQISESLSSGLGVLLEGTDFDQKEFREMLLGNQDTELPDHIFRILNYPGFKDIQSHIEQQKDLKLPGTNFYRAGPHTDLNALTYLLAAKGKGLQVLHNNQWHALPLEDGDLVVNIGDCVEKVTRGYLPSTIHQVVSPVDKLDQLEARMSMPFFGQPPGDKALKPVVSEAFANELQLQTRYNSDNQYHDAMTFTEFLHRRLDSTGLLTK